MINFILLSGIILIVVLAGLIVLFFIRKKKKVSQIIQKPEVQKKEVPKKKDLGELIKVIQNKKTNSKVLQSTLELVLQDYAEIHNFSIYEKILLTITKHPHTNKDIILNFDKKLTQSNPEYKKQINQAVAQGLDFKN